MADEERDPPSDRNGGRATGRHRALTSADLVDWETQKRAIDKAERARREDAKHRGALEVRITQLGDDVRIVKQVADTNIQQIALHGQRLAALEADVKKYDANNDFVVGANAVLATLKWAIPVLLTATAALASGITFLLVHK